MATRRRKRKDGWAELLFNRSVNFVPPIVREPLDWIERNGKTLENPASSLEYDVDPPEDGIWKYDSNNRTEKEKNIWGKAEKKNKNRGSTGRYLDSD